MTCFLYSRVSTGEQARNGESLEVQRQQLLGYAKSKKLSDVEFVEEAGVSASKQKTKNRAKWSEMFSRLVPGDVIVATKLDRLFRSVADAASTVNALRKKQVQLHLVDKNGLVAGSINDELSFNIVAAVAQFDSQLKSERISEVKQSMKRRGLWIGGKKEKGFSRRRAADGAVVAIVDESEKLVLEECVRWMRKREDELASGKKQRASKFTAESLRMKLLDISQRSSLVKMNYKRKIKTQDNRKIRRIKQSKKGNFSDSDLMVNVGRFSTATLYRLMDKGNSNNAIERLKRMKAIERKNLVVDGAVVRAKKRGAGGRVRQKSLDL